MNFYVLSAAISVCVEVQISVFAKPTIGGLDSIFNGGSMCVASRRSL